MPDPQTANYLDTATPVPPGLLAAAQPAAPIPDTRYDHAVIASDQTPTAPPPSPAPEQVSTPPRAPEQSRGPSGPSAIGKQIAAATGPLTPELGRRSGIRPEMVPVMNWVASGEAHSYNQLYGENQHFSDMSDHPANLGWRGDTGPDGRPTHAAGLLQWEPETWSRARDEYNSTHPNDQVHDFSDISQNKVGQFWIEKTYRNHTGRDIVADLYAGKTDQIIPALKGEWPSLDKSATHDQTLYGAQSWGRGLADQFRRDSETTGRQIAADRDRYLAAAAAAAPGSEERAQMLHEAHLAAQKASAEFEHMMKAPPVYQPADVFSGFGGVLLALAAFAGRKSAQPLTASLNAMAGAIDGMNSGNKEAYDRAYKVWDKQTDYALKLVDVQNQDIRNIMEDQRMADVEKQAQLRTLFSAYEMDQAAAALRRGDMAEVGRMTMSMQTMQRQMEIEADRVREINERIRHDYAMEGRGTAAAAGEKLEASKMFEIVDDKGKVVRQVMARERRDQPGFIDSQTGQPIALEPGQHLKQITPTTSGGGRAGAQVLRQQIGGREVLSDLQNAVRLPVGTTTGLLGGYQPGTSMLDALHGDLARALTSQDAQLMQASMASLTRELSVLMSPVYGGNYAAQQIEPLVPKAGDTVGTVLFKLARISQSADNALEAISKSPILSNDQQEYAMDLRRQINEAIPWTSQQAMEFARGGQGDKESFGDFVKEKIPSATSTGATGSTHETPVIPGSRDDYLALPKGTWYKDKDGNVYQKQSDAIAKP